MSNGGELLLMMKTAFGCGKKIVTVSERCGGLRERERDQRGVAQLTGATGIGGNAAAAERTPATRYGGLGAP